MNCSNIKIVFTINGKTPVTHFIKSTFPHLLSKVKCSLVRPQFFCSWPRNCEGKAEIESKGDDDDDVPLKTVNYF